MNEVKICRRERLRLQYLAAVDVKTTHGKVIRGNLRDIGMEGMFAKAERFRQTFPKPGDLIDIALSITQGKSKLVIGLPGKVIRCDEDGFAIIFAERLKWWPIFSLFPVNEQFLFDVVAKA